MKNNLSSACAFVLLSCGLSNAAIVVPGYDPVSDGNFSYRFINVIGTGPAGNTVDSATEALSIVSTIGAAAAPNSIGGYAFTQNDTGVISTVDNGALPGNYSIDELAVPGGAAGEDLVIQYSAGIYFPAGDYSIYVNGDDGHSISIPGVVFINRFGGVSGTPASDQLLFDAPTASSNQGAQFTVGAGGLVTTFEATWYERSIVEFFEVELRTGFGTKGTAADPEWDILREDADGSGIAINSTPFTPIPEPSGAVLLGLGSLLGLGIRRR